MGSRKLSITIPEEMAEFVQRKVASGEYSSDSEVFRDGLRLLRSHDAAVESWLRNEVAQSFDEMKQRETLGMSADDLRAKLATHRRLRPA